MMLSICTHLIKLHENDEIVEHVTGYVQTPDQVAKYLHIPDQIG
jgi:hypothetical protein